jgi:stage II sporulation protein AA (anti-sigma F factor antagonist)
MSEVLAIKEEGKVTIVELISELDRLSVLSMKNQITELTKKRRKNFIINFSNIDHINSTVVGTLVGIRDTVRRRGGNLSLCCVNSNIRKTFDLIGASKILPIYDTEEDALSNI